MEIDIATQWRPTSTNYFDRVSKALILAHITEVGGTTMAASFLGSKKGDLSASCEKIFAGQTIVDAEVKLAALAWVPEHMRFNPSITPSPEADPDDDESVEATGASGDITTANASDAESQDGPADEPETGDQAELEPAEQA